MAALIDTETCEGLCIYADDLDPYGVDLAYYGQVSRNYFVRNKGGEDWVHLGDLPPDKRQALDERADRERLARNEVIDGLFNALRREPWLAAAWAVVEKAEETYGRQIVEDALKDYNYPCGAIGGLLIERGYLTMEHIGELLRGDPKGPPDIFGRDSDLPKCSQAAALDVVSPTV
jgi:hypothetical protein